MTGGDRPAPVRIAVLHTLSPGMMAHVAAIGTVIAPADGIAATPEELPDMMRDADALLVTARNRVDEELLALAPRLRWISSIGVGLDHVDLAACERAGIAVANTPFAVTEPTADHTFSLLLAGARRVAECDALVRAGEWHATSAPAWGLDVHARRIGIVGMGRIGKAVARRAAGFGMEIVYCNRRPLPPGVELPFAATMLPLDELLATSDFVTLHVPLTKDNYHLIGAREIGLMRGQSVLVNAGRGGLVDEDALVDALEAGTIAHAALDVVEGEPRVNPRLLACRKVTLTPHVGTATLAARGAMAAEALDNLRRMIDAG